MTTVREPAVSGQFYPAESKALQHAVSDYLQQANNTLTTAPKAIIVPHAGYIYSGPIAASAYATLAPVREVIHRVVLLGPSHHVGFSGVAITDAAAYRTPLGDVPVDQSACEELLQLRQVNLLPMAHRQEHSLEVQLPFLQTALSEFSLIPIVVGLASKQEIAEILELLWGGDETLIVISSDLSHYHDYVTAQQIDATTTEAIVGLQPDLISHDQACGGRAIRGLLYLAAKRHLHITTLDLRNSGDTAGPRDRVVGYGAYAITN